MSKVITNLNDIYKPNKKYQEKKANRVLIIGLLVIEVLVVIGFIIVGNL